MATFLVCVGLPVVWAVLRLLVDWLNERDARERV